MPTENKLVQQINSLLELDAKNALVPHGVGGLARELLTSAAAMLAAAPASPQAAQPVAWIVTDMNGDSYFAYDRQTPNDKPLYTHADAGEVERLKDALDECDGDRWKLRDQVNTLRAKLAEAKYNECLSCADDAEAMGANAVADHLRQWAEEKRTALSTTAKPEADHE